MCQSQWQILENVVRSKEQRGSSFPRWGWRRGSYLDRARPCLSSCGCRSVRRIPASTVTCFFSLSTCKRQHRLERARPHLGPCFPATPLWDVGTAVSVYGPLKVLFSLKGNMRPDWPHIQMYDHSAPTLQVEGLPKHVSAPW